VGEHLLIAEKSDHLIDRRLGQAQRAGRRGRNGVFLTPYKVSGAGVNRSTAFHVKQSSPTILTMNAARTSALREWQVIAALSVIGAILRFWSFPRLSLTHFDEGIYAFAGLWIAADRGLAELDPMVIAYSPPGFPILVGLGYLVGGVRDLSAIGVATVCGAATVPLVGWFARRTVGQGAGAAAAAFAAFSVPHLAFSRKALTDAPFLLTWLIALALGARFLERPGLLRALGLGVAVGLAQNFKYNGWLAGVLVLLAGLEGLLVRREFRTGNQLLRTFAWGVVAAGVAGLLYLPWYRFVSSQHAGGYAALIQHHRSYLGSTATWGKYLELQLGQSAALGGSAWWRAGTWVVATLAQGICGNGVRVIHEWRGAPARKFLAVLLVGGALLALDPNVGWWLALAGTPWLLVSPQPALRILGSWWLVLSAITPFYHPYARLWLPLHALCWLVLAAGPGLSGATLGDDRDSSFGVSGSKRRRVAIASFAVACVVVGIAHSMTHPARHLPLNSLLAPRPDGSLRSFVAGLAARNGPIRRNTIQVWARRPLPYYMAAQGVVRFQTEPGLDRLMRTPAVGYSAIIDEAMLVQNGAAEETFGRLRRFWKPEWSSPTEADPVTLLDVDPQAAFARQPRTDFTLWVMSPSLDSKENPP
jgi:4-amino-4-deoxy-L-arabinose transferase-like glycosyltransferase